VDHPKVQIEECEVLPPGRHAVRKGSADFETDSLSTKSVWRIFVPIETEHDDHKLDDWEAETGLRPHPDTVGPHGILLHIGPCPYREVDQTLASEVESLNERIEEAQETGHYELVTVLTAQLDAVQKLHIDRLNDRGDYAD
jgi:hypothetical protein